MFDWLDEKGIVDFYFERTYHKDRLVSYNHKPTPFLLVAMVGIISIISFWLEILIIPLLHLLGLILILSSVLGFYIESNLDKKIKESKY